MSTNTDRKGAASETIDAYRAARDAYYVAAAREDATFARYFAKRVNGEKTNGAAVSRAMNVTSYASAEMAQAQGRIYAMGMDPWDIDDQDGVERTPIC